MTPLRAARLLLLLPAAAAALPPARYLPAPAGLMYFMAYGAGTGMGKFASSDSVPVSTLDIGVVPPPPHFLKSAWSAENAELGLMAGYGLGPFLFFKGNDLSLSVPVYGRSFEGPRFYDASVDPNDSTRLTLQSLHPSVREGQAGSGLGDIAAAWQGMAYADPGAGTWGSLAVKVVLPTASPRADRAFARILHGTYSRPGGGASVAQVVPAVTLVKLVGGQRLYLDAEYAAPLGKDSFKFTNDTYVDPASGGAAFADSGTRFTETFTPKGVVLGTLGLETSFHLWGVTPGLEVSLRQYQASSWTENGQDPLAPQPYSALEAAKPNHPADFLRAAAWSVAGIPLKANTEIEIALLASWRIHANDLVKAGLTYATNSFGGYTVGAKVSFTNLLVQKTEEEMERAAYGTVHTREFEAAPVIAAPAAPTGMIMTGVTFPASGPGVSQEEADWAGQRLRAAVRGLAGYELFPAADMAQLGQEPCGDPECGTRFGRALKLPAMVVSRVDKTATGFTLTASLVDVAAGIAAASDAVSAPALEDLRKDVPALLQRLTRPPAAQ